MAEVSSSKEFGVFLICEAQVRVLTSVPRRVPRIEGFTLLSPRKRLLSSV